MTNYRGSVSPAERLFTEINYADHLYDRHGMAKKRRPVGTAPRVQGISVSQTQGLGIGVTGQQDRLLEVLRAGRVISFEWDRASDTVERSANADEILGPDATRDTGRLFLSRVHAEDRERLSGVMGALVPERPDYVATYRYRRETDGQELLLEDSGRAEFDASGKMVRVRGVVRDVTEQRRTEEAVRSVALFPEENPFPVVRVDSQGKLLFANRASLALLGEWGCKVGGLVPEGVGVAVREALAAGSTRELTSVVGGRMISLILVPIEARGYANLYGRDVTEQKRAQEELRKSEAKYRSLFNSIDDGFCIIEVLFGADEKVHDYRFLEVNPAFERHTGLSGVVGKRVLEMLPNQDAHWFETYGRVALTGEPKRFAARGEALGRYFDVYAFRVGEPEERKVAVLFRDETQRKQAEDAVRESEEKLRHAAELVGLCPYTWDPRTGALEWSEGIRELWGLPPVGKVDFSVWLAGVHPEDRAFVEERVARCLDPKGDGIYEAEYRVKAADGVERWVSARGCTSFAEGQAASHIGVAVDVTMRRQDQLALRASEEQFRSITDTTPVIMWMTDATGSMQFVNRAYREFFGVTLEQVAGPGKWQPLVHPEDVEDYSRACTEALTKQRPLMAEARVRRADGQWRWIHSYGAPRFDEKGQFLGIAGSSPDITERKEFQAELERLVAERTAKLRELVGELEHFSYTITHDLKSPLRAMRGFAEVVSEICDKGEARDFLNRISTAAERMDRLIADALSYSRALRQELPLEDVDAGKLLRGMLDSYPELQPEKARIRLEGRLPVVLANEAGLTQCFSNLLGNAVKFAKRGETPDIRVWGSRQDGWVRIWVEDQGIGIAKEMLPRVFDMFVRGSNDHEGTGIGLALVRKAAQRMGGKVGVESEEGKGSRFWIELKSGEADSALAVAAVRQAQATGGLEGTVLYVEDEETDAIFMQRAFAGKGLNENLRRVKDGRAAIDYLSGSGEYCDRGKFPVPAVVLLDLNLPLVPGFEVLQWMRNHPDYGKTPVVVFSSSTREDDRVKAQELGASEFLSKPSSGLEFGKVAEVLRGKWIKPR